MSDQIPKRQTWFVIDTTSNVAAVREVVANLDYQKRWREATGFEEPNIAGIQFRVKGALCYVAYGRLVERLPSELAWLPLRGVALFNDAFEASVSLGHYRYDLMGQILAAGDVLQNIETGVLRTQIVGKTLFSAHQLYGQIARGTASPWQRAAAIANPTVMDHFFDGRWPDRWEKQSA